jgi:ACS family hexuronate transporter-like MFS transporter
LSHIFLTRRFLTLVIVVVSINSTWHYFRVWLPLFLQIGHGYSENVSNSFMSGYYIATDVGAILAGWATLRLTRSGLSVFASRLLVFFICACLTLLSAVAAFLPPGPVLFVVLLIIGFAALGLFPNYYSLTQELTVTHQGKVTGTLTFVTWMVTAQMHDYVGKLIKESGSYSLGVALAGLPPMIAFVALYFLWDRPKPELEVQPEVKPIESAPVRMEPQTAGVASRS